MKAQKRKTTMNKPTAAVILSALTATAMIGVGCATDPRQIPQTDYDKSEVFRIPDEDVPTFKKLIKSDKKTISVCVNTDAAAAQMDSAMSGQSIQAELQSALDGLSFLRTVTANDDLVSFINAGYGGEAPQDLPDYILLCKLIYVSSVKDAAVQTLGAVTAAGLGIGTIVAAGEGKTTSALGMGGGTVAAGAATATMIPRKVSIKTYFELYDRYKGATIFSKTIAKEEMGVAESGVGPAFQRLFALSAKEYMEQIASKIGPVGQVLKTTGGGKYAYISLGSDAGLSSDGYVQFLRREKYDDAIVAEDEDEEDSNDGEKDKKLGRKERIDFESVAEGRVMTVNPIPLLEAKRAWIEVRDFNEDNPLVKRGMPVRIVPVPRKGGWMEHFGIGGAK